MNRVAAGFVAITAVVILLFGAVIGPLTLHPSGPNPSFAGTASPALMIQNSKDIIDYQPIPANGKMAMGITKDPSGHSKVTHVNGYFEPDAASSKSSNFLNAEELHNASDEELEYMRCLFYAVHGYCFTEPQVRKKFSLCTWYKPNTHNKAAVELQISMSARECENINLILKEEAYRKEIKRRQGPILPNGIGGLIVPNTKLR